MPPASFTTLYVPRFHSSRISGGVSTRFFTCGWYWITVAPSARTTRSTTWGTNTVPPLASAAYAIASCITVTSTSPCPVAPLIV